LAALLVLPLRRTLDAAEAALELVCLVFLAIWVSYLFWLEMPINADRLAGQ
jgi:hypothetical protein